MDIVMHTGKRARLEKERKISRREGEKLVSPKELFERYTMEEIKNWKCLDLYYLMGVSQEESAGFSEPEFKKAYKSQARLFHPDLLQRFQIQDNGLSFIALTKAYQTLSNSATRRQYDCVLFDEAIPENRTYTPEEFFDVFGEAFERNSVFSTKPYTVDFGHKDTPESQVVAFYKFWQSFDSSRSFEFLCADEDCINREMKRQAVQKNKEILARKKSEDSVRIRRLIELSLKNDPRIKRKGPSVPQEEVSVDSDGWKNTEIAKLVQLTKMHPRSLRNRMDIITSTFLRYFPSRDKKDLLRKILQIEQGK